MNTLSKMLTFTIITTTLSYTMDPPLSGQALFEQNKSRLNVKLRGFIESFARWPKEEQNKVTPHARGGLGLGRNIALDDPYYGDPGFNGWLQGSGAFDPDQWESLAAAINYLKELPSNTGPTCRNP